MSEMDKSVDGWGRRQSVPDKVQTGRKKAQHTWYDHNLEMRVSGNRRKKPHNYSQTERAQETPSMKGM